MSAPTLKVGPDIFAAVPAIYFCRFRSNGHGDAFGAMPPVVCASFVVAACVACAPCLWAPQLFAQLRRCAEQALAMDCSTSSASSAPRVSITRWFESADHTINGAPALTVKQLHDAMRALPISLHTIWRRSLETLPREMSASIARYGGRSVGAVASRTTQGSGKRIALLAWTLPEFITMLWDALAHTMVDHIRSDTDFAVELDRQKRGGDLKVSRRIYVITMVMCYGGS